MRSLPLALALLGAASGARSAEPSYLSLIPDELVESLVSQHRLSSWESDEPADVRRRFCAVRSGLIGQLEGRLQRRVRELPEPMLNRITLAALVRSSPAVQTRGHGLALIGKVLVGAGFVRWAALGGRTETDLDGAKSRELCAEGEGVHHLNCAQFVALSAYKAGLEENDQSHVDLDASARLGIDSPLINNTVIGLSPFQGWWRALHESDGQPFEPAAVGILPGDLLVVYQARREGNYGSRRRGGMAFHHVEIVIRTHPRATRQTWSVGNPSSGPSVNRLLNVDARALRALNEAVAPLDPSESPPDAHRFVVYRFGAPR